MLKRWYDYYLIFRSGLFDSAYYQRTYPESRKAGLFPILNYIKTGWKEGKNPSAEFDTRYYLRENLDVRYFGINPLIHYIQCGQAEGRAPTASLSEDPTSYAAWVDAYDTQTDEDEALIHSHISSFSQKPCISILMAVDSPSAALLRETLDSVTAQLYPNWELCVAVNPNSDPFASKIIDAYAQKDPRIKVTPYNVSGDVADALNTTLSISSGDFVGLLHQEDVLRKHALYMVVNEINEHPAAAIIYSDEDRINDQGDRYDPYFKPDWNPDLFLAQNFMVNLGCCRAEAIRNAGGFRKGYDDAQVWDLLLRVVEKVKPSEIRHIPFVLYHQRENVMSTLMPLSLDERAVTAQSAAIQSHFKRIGQPVEFTRSDDGIWHTIYSAPKSEMGATLIIPTRNQSQLLKKCIDSIKNKTQGKNYEILIVNNRSDETEALAYLASLEKDEEITVLDYDHPFNFSAINNFAAQHARYEVLTFLNNDIETINPNWFDELIGHALRAEIGAVGAMLYYPNDTIQHAGVVLGIGGVAGHVYYQQHRGTFGQRGRARMAQNYSAVTGACMAIQKSKFLAVDGFDESHLAVAYNDIDLCLRLMEKGYNNLWTPFAEFYHSESATRAYEDTPEKQARIQAEADYLLGKWHQVIGHDPAYNPNLTLNLPDFSLAFPPRTIEPWKK